MYDSITIFLIILGLFSVGLFLLLCFLPREVPLAFVVKLVWWCWILLTFACLESFWFLCQIWMRVLLGRAVLVGCRFSSFITLNMLHCFLWLVEFLLRNQLITLWEFPHMLGWTTTSPPPRPHEGYGIWFLCWLPPSYHFVKFKTVILWPLIIQWNY